MTRSSKTHSSWPFRKRQLVLLMCIPLLTGLWLTLPTCAVAQIPRTRPDDANLTDEQRRDLTLRWLDRFLTESDLLKKEDFLKIRQAVEQMPSSQLQQWLEQTKTLREYVESDRWQTTKRWLREFLRVQNMYSESEMQQLRNEILNANAAQMLVIMKRIQDRYDRLVWMHQAAKKSREIAVRERDLSIAEQQAAAAVARAASAQSQPPVVDAGGGKDTRGYSVPRSLITSRETARVSVWWEMWGGAWIVGF
jgi:hypothetical protein